METVADDPAPDSGHIVEAQVLEVRHPAAPQVCEERIGPEFAFRTEREMTEGQGAEALIILAGESLPVASQPQVV